MPSVEETRATIMGAHRNAEQGLAELAQAHSSLEDARNGLQHGMTGSNQAEAEQASAQLSSALDKIDEAKQQVASALQDFEVAAHRM